MNLHSKVNQVYRHRRNQITALWSQVAKRSNNKLTLHARVIDEADVMFQGYVSRYENLMKRLNTLDEDYLRISEAIAEKSIWQRYFSWVPFVKCKEIEYMNQFLQTWEGFEVGWD